MNWSQAQKLVNAMNTIDAQRKEQYGEYATEKQGAAVTALQELLTDEGFEIRYDVVESEYRIASQLTCVY